MKNNRVGTPYLQLLSYHYVDYVGAVGPSL